MKRRKKGFTLIELIAVLVIIAIIALIVTPLVMNIIRKARVAADKRSIDAYGRSIELAIAGYLLDTGKFPTEISQLTIEYSGDTVTCETTQINPDSSVYLENCAVNNRDVEGYVYGEDKQPIIYSLGDEVTYNGVDYYVIKDSGINDNVVTLLKSHSLSYEETNELNIEGITVDEHEGFCAVEYGLTSEYDSSYVKKVVDAWTQNNVNSNQLKEARLIKLDEIETETREYDCCGGCGACINTSEFVKNSFIYSDNIPNNNSLYWTMTQVDSSNSNIKINCIDQHGSIGTQIIDGSTGYNRWLVRPVVELYKNDNIIKKKS